MPRKSNVMGAGLSALAAEVIVGACTSALTATGTTQADALLLPTTIAEITTTAASTGVVLPSGCAPGDRFFVYNIGAQTLSIYPPVGESINAVAVNGAYTMATAKSCFLVKVSSTRWATLLTA